nr:hypothetical protein BaRGS_033488 [Batillaria attramentaria]
MSLNTLLGNTLKEWLNSLLQGVGQCSFKVTVGNCLFRALGDQFEGHSRNHYRHRQEVVKYMLDHRKDFEPFVEDDVPFDEHVNNLKRLGTHAGNDAIVAFAKLHNINVMIHQLNGKPLLIQGPSSSANVRQLHIAYHNGDHYSSIRRLNDNTESPANIRLQDTSEGRSEPPSITKPATSGQLNGHGVVKAKRDSDHIELEVMRATGCQDVERVRESLMDCDYDVDASIAMLLQQLELPSVSQNSEDSTSLTSQQTSTDVDSGIWGMHGTGTRIFGVTSGGSVNGKGQKVHFREDSFGGSSGYSSLGSNRGSGARPKLLMTNPTPVQVSGRKAKELKKVEKKKRAEDRHRQRILGIDPHRQLQHQMAQDDTTVIHHDGYVTRI